MTDEEPGSEPSTSQALRSILEQHPADVLNEPEWLRNLLLDYCPDRRSEVNLLVNALVEGVPQRVLRAAEDTPRLALLGVLRSRLIKEQGLSHESADWAARTWLDVLRPETPATPPDEAGRERQGSAHAVPAPKNNRARSGDGAACIWNSGLLGLATGRRC